MGSDRQTLNLIIFKNSTVDQHVAHPLVVGYLMGSNLGPTPRHNLKTFKIVPIAAPHK